jgi:hypothetical protein
MTSSPPKVDKSVKRSHSICPYRDARFMRGLEGLYDVRLALSDADTSVCVCVCVCNAPLFSTTPALTSSTPSPLPTKSAGASSKSVKKSAPTVLSGPSPVSPSGASGRVRSKVAPWWLGKYLNEPVRRYRNPALWRDTSDILRCHYAHEAILRLGPVHTFTLRLRDDMEVKARKQGSPLGWLQKRIDRELSNALNRPVQFLLTLEEEKGRLHCHGEFQVDQVEVKTARAALRKAGGSWKTGRQHQAQTKPDPDVGWTGYISKGFWMTTPGMRRLMAPFKTKYKVTFRGSPLSITADLNAQAKVLYELHRALIRREDVRK